MFDQPSFIARLKSFIQYFLLWPWARFCGVLAIATGTLLGGIGVWLGLQSGETVALATTQARTECTTPISNFITVDVSGAVKQPGVYGLKEGSRASDAVSAAGGFSEEADEAIIATEVNLAQQLSDGSKLLIPFYTSQSVVDAQAVTQSTLLSINTASVSELESLPGIGEKRASDIVANRPYTSFEELKHKAGFTEKLLNDLIDHIRL